jgi:hypothetical protein
LAAKTAVGRGIIRDACEQARGHDLYPERSHIAETPFAHAEHNLGFPPLNQVRNRQSCRRIQISTP